jgi:glycosyltransferase involved in cell wall biosynthesis
MNDTVAPLVSVIIPAYNRAGSLRPAIESVTSQDFSDWELIVVDDGSVDDTGIVAESLADSRVRVIRHPTNRGASAARNTGIRAARGRYIAFLDSDDEWLPGKLTAQIAALEKGPEAPDLLCTGFILRYTSGRRAVERRPQAISDWFDAMIDGCSVSPGSTLVVRRSCFEQAGFLDETLSRLEDWDWLLRCLEIFRFDCLPMMGAVVHVGGHPRLEAVSGAAERLRALQTGRIARLAGAPGVRRFEASLSLELAVAAAREGRATLALIHLVNAFRLSPARVFRLLSRRLEEIA